MLQYNLHFNSKTPCNILIDGKPIGLIDNNNTFFIDVIVTKPTIIVSCEPLCEHNTTYIPISFKIDYLNNRLKCSLNKVKIIPYPENNYDIILDFNSVKTNTQNTMFNSKLNDINIVAISNNLTSISLFKNDKTLFETHQNLLQNLTAKQINNTILLTGENCNNETFLLAYDTLNNKVLINDVFEKIEHNDNAISCLKNLHNTINTGKVYNLNLDNLNIESFNVCLGLKHCNVEEALIPYLFLDSVKDGNYNYATSFLDDKLIKTTPNKLKQFFNDFNEIYYNCYNLKTEFYNYTIVGSNVRNFNFYLNKNKIYEIEEVNIHNI